MAKEQAKYHYADVLNGLEVVDAQYERQTFSKHVHEGYTIGLIEQGAQRFYRSGANHVAAENSIILVNADDVHTGETATAGGWKYKALYPTVEHFNQISKDLVNNQSLTPYFKDSVIEDARIAAQLRCVFEQIENGASKLLIETLLYSTLAQLAAGYGRHVEAVKAASVDVQKLKLAREFLDEYTQVNVSLEQLANVVGCSKFHFVRQFNQAFGITPHAYQIQARLIKAKKMLRAGTSILDTAIGCGFHDQSHFNRHFKKALGTTPKQFQLTSVVA
ncbi:AraC family transcriptional regulator [Pseudoalteromonas phenolica]|uniref:AraC family transcriptional regulator n=1 Tax=Pseudoalteromonas phenolica TaxID=161398 RepID=UPI00110B009D|nr:AraC family transcriptional regulator [Pseudoalteromonas phenolica]TMN86536.1 AraC family transcriptional regulator [Pseudoalteromonas phenolica]